MRNLLGLFTFTLALAGCVTHNVQMSTTQNGVTYNASINGCTEDLTSCSGQTTLTDTNGDTFTNINYIYYASTNKLVIWGTDSNGNVISLTNTCTSNGCTGTTTFNSTAAPTLPGGSTQNNTVLPPNPPSC